jgi:hypothetical protein
MSDENFGQTPIYPQTSSLAVISLISGIASYFIVPLLGAIVAIITGNMAKRDIKESAGRLTGEDMAKWGMILGWVNIGLSLIGLCVVMLILIGVISLPLCLLPFTNWFNF